MKLDELLKQSKKPIPDAGFTERVINRLELEKKERLAFIDLPSLEVLAWALALVLLAPYILSAQKMITETAFSAIGTLFLLAVMGVYWFTEEPLFDA